MFTDAQKSALSAPLDRTKVASRQQAGRSLSYIEGWHAIAEANRIFGFDAWHRETLELRQLGEPRMTGDKARVEYMARVRITVGDVVRDGCGFGQGIDKDVGQAHESALKEAETDAMKRALMTFGNPFGLALYDKTQANVAMPLSESFSQLIETMKQSADDKAALEWAKINASFIDRLASDEKDRLRAEYAQFRAGLKHVAMLVAA